ncbi:hypothetical protein Mgra_00003708 [Meloidogyne graminicola]|uniref:Uncharacterized protein n=1 Tax=Meloidogyne graminicola TaxID=189291 RepID=A0A8S9ZSV2_9BILA|nr:hypothetical protein Mgra_00003708 [Meloidogyne graminicola]
MAKIIYLFFLNILYLINETNGETCIGNVNAACNVGKQNCCLPKLQCCQFGLPCEEGKCCIRNGQEATTDDDFLNDY